MRVTPALAIFAVCMISDVQPQAFLCLYDATPILDWIECLTKVLPKIVVEEGTKLRQKYYKGMTALNVTLKLCADSPQFVAQYTSILRKFLKKIPSDVMDLADYDASVCANNTAFKFPPKDKDGGVLDPYSVTLENLDEIRSIPPTKAGT